MTDHRGETRPEEHEPSLGWDHLLAELAADRQEEGWVTLAEASAASGAALSTLRSWYRSGQVPSRMVVGAHGPQRLVPLDAIVERALRSAKVRRQLDQARSVDERLAALERRLAAVEAYLGLPGGD